MSSSVAPLVIDNFAGGGGASTGIEAAIGRPIDIAINHDPEAIAMHKANHPDTRHCCQSIQDVDIVAETAGRSIALAWYSPDCKHHSKAKGGKPRDKKIRDLATIVPEHVEKLLAIAPGGELAPRVIMLENVEEFRQWGPLDANDMPIKARRGEEFDMWCARLKRLGYVIEHRELRACDYGAPTSRKRLYLIARRDGRPIRWPEPTHGRAGTPAVESGQLQPWRTAADCIDWSIRCPSIFDRQRELKDATKRRIAHGVMRYVVNCASPFIVRAAHGDDGRHRTHPLTDPIGAQPASNEFAVVDAGIVPITHTQGGNQATSPNGPIPTITTAKGGEFARASVTLAPHITKFRGNAIGSPANDPMPTVTANGNPARPAGAQPLAYAEAQLAPVIIGCGGRRGQSGPVDPNGPYPTTTAKADACVVAATMVQAGYGEREGQAPRALDVEAPLGTVVAGGNKHAAVTAFLSHFYGSNKTEGRGDPTAPAKAVTSTGQHHAVVCAHMEQANTGMIGHDMRESVSTIVGKGSTQRLVETTLIDADALPADLLNRAVNVAAFLVKYYGAAEHGQPLDRPIDAVTSLPRFAVVTVTIDAVTYVIVDIGMRMLTRRELANAQGFPPSYILDPIGPKGRPLSISSSIRMIGNSVCRDVAEAMVRANLPEMCGLAEREQEAA